MRATTFSMPKVSRATRAMRMFELSPLVTAASEAACSMPASFSRSRSKPMPLIIWPLKSLGRRPKASGRLSMTATV